MNKSSGRHSFIPSPELPSRRWVVFGLCALLYLCSMFYRVANAVIAPQLQQDLQVSAEQLGLLSAAFFYAFALAQLPLGPCLDKIGARLTITCLSLTGAVGAWIFAAADGMVGATIGRSLLGLGMAASFMGALKLFTRWFSPGEFAMLSGLVYSFGCLGTVLATTPLALLVEALGWRVSFLIIGGMTAGISMIFFIVVRNAPEGEEEFPVSHTGGQAAMPFVHMARILFTSRQYWLISCSTFFRYGTSIAIQALWAGPYLINVLHFSELETGNLLFLLNLGLIIGAPVGGWLSDRVICSRKWVIIVGLAGLAMAVLALAMGWGKGQMVVLGGIFLFLGIFSSFGLIMYAHIKEVMPQEMSGMALTGINLFTMLGGGVFVHGMGKVLDLWTAETGPGADGYGAAFFMGFLGLLIAIGLYLCIKEGPEKAHLSKN